MPKNYELKQRARLSMVKAVPNACVVALVLFVLTWLFQYLDQKISGAQVILDMREYNAGNFDSAVSFQSPHFTVVGVILSAALYFLDVLLNYGFTFYTLDITRRQKAGILTLLDSFTVWWKAFVLNLLMMVFAALWGLLLIVPGVIALYRYSMAVFLLHDHPDWGPMQCIRESSRLMKGNKSRLFSLDISFLGWLLLTIIPGISVYVNPYYSCTKAEFYNHLIGYQAVDASADNNQDKQPWEY